MRIIAGIVSSLTAIVITASCYKSDKHIGLANFAAATNQGITIAKTSGGYNAQFYRVGDTVYYGYREGSREYSAGKRINIQPSIDQKAIAALNENSPTLIRSSDGDVFIFYKKGTNITYEAIEVNSLGCVMTTERRPYYYTIKNSLK